MRLCLLTLALAARCALAQPSSSSSTSAASSSTSSSPAIHTITVGKANNQFEPSSLNASVGDTVIFQFYPSNHSVAKSQYGYPCIPYEDLGSDRTGWFSGFEPVATIGDDLPTYNITINDTQPLFYYCTAPGSCIDYGMVGAINPNSSTPVSKQMSLAKQADYMLQPGEAFPAEAAASATSIAAETVTATATASPTSTTSSAPIASKKSSLSGGAIGGIVIGAVALLGLLALLAFLILRSRKNNHNHNQQQNPQYPTRPGSATASQYSHAQSYPQYTTPEMHHAGQNSIWGAPPPLPAYAQYDQKPLPRIGAEELPPPMRTGSPPMNPGPGPGQGMHPAYYAGYGDAINGASMFANVGAYFDAHGYGYPGGQQGGHGEGRGQGQQAQSSELAGDSVHRIGAEGAGRNSPAHELDVGVKSPLMGQGESEEGHGVDNRF